MPRKKKEKIENELLEKFEYLGLDLDKIPENLKNIKPLEYRVPRIYDEKKYKQYKYIPVRDIQILLSPTNRLEDLSERYKKARPLYEYLDSKNEENIVKNDYDTMFLLKIADFVITDYSAIAYEASIFDRPLYFYLYDIKEYSKNRGLNVDLSKEMKNATYNNAKDLIKALEKDYNYEELYRFRNKKTNIRRRF